MTNMIYIAMTKIKLMFLWQIKV